MIERELTEAEKADARELFEGRVDGRTACQHCGGIHAHVVGLPSGWQPCPRIRKIERHTDGAIIAVEYWPNGAWEADVIFPGHVYDVDDDTDTRG